MLYVKPVDKLPIEEELALVRKAQSGDRVAEYHLVHLHMEHVRRYATLFARLTGDDIEEATADALEGVAIALRKFDPDRGFRFLTYASQWMAARMYRQARERRSVVHRPYKHSMATHDASLDAPVRDDGMHFETWLDRLEDAGVSAEQQVIDHEECSRIRRQVHKLLEMLPKRSRLIVRERLMQDSEDAPALHELGNRLNLSRERIRQIENKSVAKMRRHYRAA
jgi:RNA polymerase sigma factor (sigma-70 family)